MPPHCDTLDGPVVQAARGALAAGNVNLILPWVPKDAEQELCEAFQRTMRVRQISEETRELADYWFFETTVRLHRAGEGAPYTGLKPAGLDTGPVVPLAEKAIEQGDPRDVIRFLQHAVEEALQDKFHAVVSTKHFDENNVEAAREYVEAMLGFTVYSHHLLTSLHNGGDHEEEGHAAHEHKH